MSDKTHHRYDQSQIAASPEFLTLVEMSVLIAAYRVLQDTSDPNYAQRAGLARTVMFAATPQEQRDSITRLFAAWVVNDGDVISEYTGGGGTISAISDQAFDDSVMEFWNFAADAVELEE